MAIAYACHRKLYKKAEELIFGTAVGHGMRIESIKVWTVAWIESLSAMKTE